VVVPCGNTSEYSSLTVGEVELVGLVTIEEINGRATVISGVGGNLRTAVQLSKTFVLGGADGIMIHYPSDPYLSDEGLVRYYSTLAESTDGAVIIYARDRGFSSEVFGRLLGIPNVVAVKYSFSDVRTFSQLVRQHQQDIVWICGLAETLAPFFWLAGGRGFSSGLANVAPELSLALLSALRAENYPHAMQICAQLAPFEELRAEQASGNNVPVVKEALALLGLIEPTVRPPLARLSPSDASQLTSIVAQWKEAMQEEWSKA
jgi:4-hydroxy-tetrahydrodipicolinate synthase